jgi:uncharacterized protein (DUF3820 family)
MVLKLNSKLPFGKYKGKTVKEIITIDGQYLVWLHYSKYKITMDITVLNTINPQTKYK